MGSYLVTCGVSNISINWGDPVYYFILQRTKMESCGSGNCYSTNQWFPISPAVKANYSDRSMVKDIKVTLANKMFLDKFNEDNEKSFKSIKSLTKKIADYKGYAHESQFAKNFGLMFVHADIYKEMIKYDPIIYSRFEDDAFYAHTSKAMEFGFKQYYNDLIKFYNSNPNDNKKLSFAFSPDLYVTWNKFSGIFTRSEDYSYAIRNFHRYFCDKAQNNIPFEDPEIQKIGKSMMNFDVFRENMNKAKAYFQPPCGAGSQDIETSLNKKIAKRILKICKAREDEFEMNNDLELESNLKEIHNIKNPDVLNYILK